MKLWRRFSGTVSLREAAGIIFALTAVLPLLIFLFFLNRFDLLTKAEAQISLFLAVVVALLGLVLFRGILNRVSKLAEALRAPSSGSRGGSQEEVPALTVPGLGIIAEVAQIREVFFQTLGELQRSTERLQDVAFKLVGLNEMVELAAQVPRLQDLLTLTLERAMQTVRAQVGSIMLLDPERQTLRVAAIRGLPSEVQTEGEVKVGEELAGKAAELGEPIVVENIETDPRFTDDSAAKYGGGSVICTPIRVKDRIIGVINLAKREYGVPSPVNSCPFTAVDLQFLNPLVTYVAYALDNARLLEETRETANRLKGVIDELRAAQEELVRWESLRAMGTIALGVNHHLNNLLAVVLGRVQFLLRKVDDSGIRYYLEIAERAALEASDVVRRLRELGWTYPVAQAVLVDVNQLPQEALELTRPHWQYETQLRGIQIVTSLERGSIPAIEGDPAALRESLVGLLLNAVDALPCGGKITVRTWASEQGILCSVADTGMGMSAEVCRRALEPFFTTKGPQSKGLGLSVAYGVVQRHRGDLAIESAEGRGTTVTICLPMTQSKMEAGLLVSCPRDE